MLNQIKAQSDVKRRCMEMLKYWMSSHPNATWNQLLAALKAPGVELHSLAASVEIGMYGVYVRIDI